MIRQHLSQAILLILGGAGAFTLAWYLLGVGVGIAQRGYNRVAPYRVTTRVVPPTSYRRHPQTWEEWDASQG